MSILKTIYLQHLNGSNNNITLAADGKVGIGTSTPLSKIHISEANTGVYPAITLENTVSSGLTPGVSINWTQSGVIKSSIESNVYGQDYMAFRVNSNIERMRIDGEGRVTMLYQPAFFAYPNTNTSLGTTTSPYIFAVTTFNRGSNYSTSTGRFTAPVAGAYHFSYGVQHNANFNDNLVVDLRVNGGQYGGVVRGEWTTGALFNMVTASATIYLNVNDYVTIDSIGGTGWGDDAWFSGHLIG